MKADSAGGLAGWYMNRIGPPEAADEADLAARLRALRDSQARFELYEDRTAKWCLRLRHRNGNVIADGGEGYTDRSSVHDAIESIKGKRWPPTTPSTRSDRAASVSRRLRSGRPTSPNKRYPVCYPTGPIVLPGRDRYP